MRQHGGLLFDDLGKDSNEAGSRESPPRLRYRLMKVHWDLIKSKHGDRPAFLRYDSGIWDQLIAHLLGPKVYGYRSGDAKGLRWVDFLSYELAEDLPCSNSMIVSSIFRRL